MKHITLCVSLIALLIGPATASAVGFGINGTLSSGELEFDDGFNDDIDNDTREIGLVLDTGRGGLFNFRLNVNLIDGELSDRFSEAEYEGIGINTSFGFRLIQNRAIRLWLGPSVDVQFLENDDEPNRSDEATGFGIGPVLGLDFHAGPGVRLGLETGAKLRIIEFEEDAVEDEADLDGSEVFLRLSVLFGSHQPRRH